MRSNVGARIDELLKFQLITARHFKRLLQSNSAENDIIMIIILEKKKNKKVEDCKLQKLSFYT